MTIFSGFFFTLALHLQDGLGYSALRAGLTFAPTAVAFALVQLGLLVGVATFGTLYLNLACRLPGHAALGAFRPVSAHAEAVTLLALAGLAAVGVLLAAIHVLERRHPPA